MDTYHLSSAPLLELQQLTWYIQVSDWNSEDSGLSLGWLAFFFHQLLCRICKYQSTFCYNQRTGYISSSHFAYAVKTPTRSNCMETFLLPTKSHWKHPCPTNVQVLYLENYQMMWKQMMWKQQNKTLKSSQNSNCYGFWSDACTNSATRVLASK